MFQKYTKVLMLSAESMLTYRHCLPTPDSPCDMGMLVSLVRGDGGAFTCVCQSVETSRVPPVDGLMRVAIPFEGLRLEPIDEKSCMFTMGGEFQDPGGMDDPMIQVGAMGMFTGLQYGLKKLCEES